MNEDPVTTPPAEVLPAQIERLDSRLRQIEKIAETVESIAENGFAAATKYLESKAESERKEAETADAQHQREIEFQDKLHKRSVVALSLIVLAVFTLVVIAMFMGQFELVKIILGSSLAVAGGAGIAGLFKGRSK